MLLMLHPESIKFRQLQPGANTAYVLGSFFRTDRRFIDSTIFPSEMPAIWAIQGQRVVLDAPGNPSIRQMSFEVTRLPNWGWHLYSSLYKVEMMSMQERALTEAAAEGVSLQWPEIVAESALSEAWEEYDVFAADDEEECDGEDGSLDDDFQQLLMGPNGEDEETGDDAYDAYAGCYDSPAQYPESEQSDADHYHTEPPMPAGISPRTLQRTLNEMLLYDSYGSDDMAPAPKRVAPSSVPE